MYHHESLLISDGGLLRKRHSLTALRAFEAVARHGSISVAARELIVTRPAISKQIKLLEDQLDCLLLKRSGNAISLTASGDELFAGLNQAFDLIAVTTERISARGQQEQKIKILVERDFASAWLAERIGLFLVQNPGISVEVRAEQNGFLHMDEDFSFRINYGKSGQSGPLLDEKILHRWIDIPLCTNGYAQEHIQSATDVEINTLHYLIDSNTQAWQDWFRYAGHKMPDIESGCTIFNETTLCLSAAMAGGGIAIGSFLALAALKSEALIAPYKIGIESEDAYCIFTPAGRSLSKAERAFESWLHQTVSDYQEGVYQYFSEQEIQIIGRAS